jgi:hypothetical protein
MIGSEYITVSFAWKLSAKRRAQIRRHEHVFDVEHGVLLMPVMTIIGFGAARLGDQPTAPVVMCEHPAA